MRRFSAEPGLILTGLNAETILNVPKGWDAGGMPARIADLEREVSRQLLFHRINAVASLSGDLWARAGKPARTAPRIPTATTNREAEKWRNSPRGQLEDLLALIMALEMKG